MIIKPYLSLIRFQKPIGFFLLLWPTLWALWIANSGAPSLSLFCIFLMGTFLMRSAGCIINDIADRKIDPLVLRTQHRPLARGDLSVRSAWIFFVILCALSFLLVLLTNLFTLLLALCALGVAIIYPFMKRYTHLPQVFLGIAFSFGTLMAFSATINALPPVAWLVFAIACLWPIIYDTLYAMSDRPYDQTIGVKSTAILFGAYDKKIIAILQAIWIGLLLGLGIWQTWNITYYLVLACCVGLLFYQHYLIRNRDPKLCFKAFLNNNWIGLLLFLGIFLQYS